MPTASDELRGLMEKWFGDGISECGPIKFLESHGYTLRPDWFWEKPVPAHSVSDYEWYCLRFLIDEWDFGGLWSEKGHPPPLEIGDDAFNSHI